MAVKIIENAKTSRPSVCNAEEVCLVHRDIAKEFLPKLTAALVAKRLSNREIAEQLFLSEGSVKQYINQIYSKLLITGDVRTKRKRLAELAAPKS